MKVRIRMAKSKLLLAGLTLLACFLAAPLASAQSITAFSTTTNAPNGTVPAQTSVTLSTSITGSATFPAGTVQFFINNDTTSNAYTCNIGSTNTLIGSAVPLAGSGSTSTASLSTSTLPVGGYYVCATYTPSIGSPYTTTTTSTLSTAFISVTALTVSSFTITNTSGSPTTASNPLTLSVNLSGNTVSGPSGSVEFFTSTSNTCASTSYDLGQQTLTVNPPAASGGNYTATASITSPSAPPGSYYACANYIPDANSDFSSTATASGAAVSVTGQITETDSTTATATPSTVVYGQFGSVGYGATVTPSSGAPGIPSGSVNFTLTGPGASTTQLALGSSLLSPATTAGTLVPSSSNPQASTLPFRAVPVDLRGNGLLDVVAAPLGGDLPTPYLEVFLNSGFNSFEAETDVQTGCTSVADFAVGDLNGDGIADLIALCYSPAAGAPLATYMLGNGNGTFQAANPLITSTSITNPANLSNIVMGDFNGDGVMDVALMDGFDGQIQVYTGSATFGTFTPLNLYSFTAGSAGISDPAVADFNQDGKSDIALIQEPNLQTATTSSLELLTSNGDGTFSAQTQTLATTGYYFPAPVISDVNEDGFPDILIADLGNASNGQILVVENNGSGGFNAPLTYAATSPQNVAGTPFPIIGKPAASTVTQPANIFYVSYGTNGALTLTGLKLSGSSFTTVFPAQSAGYDVSTYGGSDIVLAGDFNGNGYNDAAVLSGSYPDAPNAVLTPFFYTNSSTATLAGVSQQPNAGTYSLTASYPGDPQFAPSTSKPYSVTIQQATPTGVLTSSSSTVAFGQSATFTATVASVAGGTPPTGTVTFTVTNASNSTNTTTVVALTPVSGSTSSVAQYTVNNLPISTTPYTVTAIYSGDTNYTSAGLGSLSLTVQAGSVLISITPSSGNLGDPATTITLSGAGFLSTSVAQLNGTALTTTYVSSTTLKAVIPASFFTTVQTGSVTVATPGEPLSSAVSFSVVAPAAQATLTGPSTAPPDTQPSINFQLSQPYPVPVTATFTLAVEPAGQSGLIDPAVQFSTGGNTYTVTIPANSTAPVSVQLQTGTLPAYIYVSATLSAGGTDITPSNLQQVVIQVPTSAPVVTSVSLVRSGKTLTVTVQGFSSTREVQSAYFHFTPVSGSLLANSDVTLPLNSAFSNWYSQTASDQYGSAFSYTQSFTLSQDASSIGSVTVTLTNSVGTSNPESAQ